MSACKCKAIDPTRLTALQSLDFGSVYTADGREHPVTAFSLPFLANLTNPQNSQPTSSGGTDTPSTYPVVGPNLSQPNMNFNSASTGAGAGTSTATDPNQTTIGAGPIHINIPWPQNFGTRLVVGIIAILLIVVFVWKLVK